MQTKQAGLLTKNAKCKPPNSHLLHLGSQARVLKTGACSEGTLKTAQAATSSSNNETTPRHDHDCTEKSCANMDEVSTQI